MWASCAGRGAWEELAPVAMTGMCFVFTDHNKTIAMERAIVILEQLRLLTDDHQLYIVREDEEWPSDQHGRHERQLDEWRDMMHRLHDAGQKQRA